MKLYQVTIDNGAEYEDNDWEKELVVAENQEDAESKAVLLMVEHYGAGYGDRIPQWWVEEITKVDGYEIKVVRHDD